MENLIFHPDFVLSSLTSWGHSHKHKYSGKSNISCREYYEIIYKYQPVSHAVSLTGMYLSTLEVPFFQLPVLPKSYCFKLIPPFLREKNLFSVTLIALHFLFSHLVSCCLLPPPICGAWLLTAQVACSLPLATYSARWKACSRSPFKRPFCST